MHRTIKLKLDTTPAQKQALLNTLAGFTHAFNFVCEYAWLNSEKNSTALHKATYYPLKARLNLPSQLICAARVKATEAIKSALALKKAGRKASQPRSKLCPVRYDQRSYRVDWTKCEASLASCAGRQIVKFSVPHYAASYTGYPVASADLIYRKGQLWLNVIISLPAPEFSPNDKTVGVDLGLNQPAVTSERNFLGKRHWKEVERRNFRLKRALQSKGTKSAKRHLKKLAGRQRRFRTDCDHVLSKRIVQSVPSGTTIVLEDLGQLRSRARLRSGEGQRRLHSWSFAQLRSFVSYKAEERGMSVVVIDPRYTSQTCSRCGYRHRANRKVQALFECKKCAYSLNADLNAAYNIRDKHLATLGKTLGSGSQSIGLAHQPFG